MADLDDLRAAWARKMEVPFPLAGDGVLGDLHAEMAEYDGYVAGTIECLLAGEPVDPKQLVLDEDFGHRIEAAAKESGSEDGRILLEFFRLLADVLRIARA